MFAVEDSNYLYMLILLTLLFSFTLPAMIQITALKCWSNVRCLVFQMMILVATLMIMILIVALIQLFLMQNVTLVNSLSEAVIQISGYFEQKRMIMIN